MHTRHKVISHQLITVLPYAHPTLASSHSLHASTLRHTQSRKARNVSNSNTIHTVQPITCQPLNRPTTQPDPATAHQDPHKKPCTPPPRLPFASRQTPPELYPTTHPCSHYVPPKLSKNATPPPICCVCSLPPPGRWASHFLSAVRTFSRPHMQTCMPLTVHPLFPVPPAAAPTHHRPRHGPLFTTGDTTARHQMQVSSYAIITHRLPHPPP